MGFGDEDNSLSQQQFEEWGHRLLDEFKEMADCMDARPRNALALLLATGQHERVLDILIVSILENEP